MKVSKNWLKELVNLKVSIKEVEKLLPLRTIGTKEITEEFIELDMKGYNRSDLLSMRGVAEEVAAITDSQITFKDDEDYVWADRQLPQTPVRIEEEELSKVQAVAKIEGLKFGKSVDVWVKKLQDSGMRSVNNIADVTNLVMLEYGHPLHAFDASTIKNDTINTRRAVNGEEITTLDGKVRKLSKEDIVLADEGKALDVAGVMGGKDTEIKESTNTILLSASLFNPSIIRKTSQKLKLTSEASKRFYHGLTKKRLLQAFNSAIKMYQELGGKLVAVNIVGDTKDEVKEVILTQEKLDNLIGVHIEPEQVEKYLEKLNFSSRDVRSNNKSWLVTPPYYRLDIEREEDLIEEIARMYGYEKIPSTKLAGEPPSKIDQSLFELIYNLKSKLAEIGLTEVQTYSFFSTRTLKNLGWFKDDNTRYLVKIANPISSETEYMRQNVWPNLVEVIDQNLRQGFSDIAIFEIGKAYFTFGKEIKEQYRLSVALLNETDNPVLELLEIVKQVMKDLKKDMEIKISKQDGPLPPLFHPTRYLQLESKGKPFDPAQDRNIGGAAEVHPRLLNDYGIEKRVAMLEINLEELL